MRVGGWQPRLLLFLRKQSECVWIEWRTQIGKKYGKKYASMMHISHGHFSDVFVGTDRVLKKARSSSHAERHVRNELRVLSKLAHPNIVSLRGFHWEDGTLTLVLEHGGQDWFAHGDHDSHDFFCDVMRALVHLHGQRICHRDLKFDNVLIAPTEGRNVAKLCDFGFAHCYADAEPERSLTDACGSQLYAGPEVILGVTHSGMCADVWAFGTMVFLGHTQCFLLPENKSDRLRAIKYFVKHESTRAFCDMARTVYDKSFDMPVHVQEVVDVCVKVRPPLRKKVDEIASLDFFASSES